MKKILIISSTFPPNSSVGGLRPFYFFKYFNQSELDTFVFTINHDSHNVKMDLDINKSLEHKVYYCNYSKNSEREYLKNRTIAKKVRDFFNPSYSSPPGLLDRAKEEIQQVYNINDFDMILATVPDMWTATLGSLLAKKYNKKLIIDFRDAHEQESGMPRSFRQKVQTYRLLAERQRTVKNTFELITVSKYLAHQLNKKLNKKTTVIYNGFEEKLFNSDNNSVKKNNDSKIRIVYAGRIINFWYQNPIPLIKALEYLKNKSNQRIELHFYGVDKVKLSAYLNKDYSDYIFLHDRVPFTKVSKILAEADLLLILSNNGRRGILTTKLYEYMPMQKPVICLPNDDKELTEIIDKYGLGFSFKNKEDVITFFKNYDQNLALYKSNKNSRSDLTFFTRENQSKLLADRIKQILK